MKKGLIAVVLVAVLAAGGAGGYTVYQKKVAEKKYEQDMTKTISSLPAITVYEKEDLPSVEEEFKGTESNINIDSITPDISGVHTSEPGEYDVKYTFKDSHGTDRTATVKCTVKPELASHVEGMQDIEIDKGDELPTESGCTFDDYVSSVTLNTDEVDNEEAGTYDISYTVLGADGDMKTVEGYSDAISDTLADGGPMHSVYVQLRVIALGMLAVYFIISFGTRMAGMETSPKVIFKTLIQYFVGFVLAMYSFEIVRLLFWLGDSMTSLLIKNTATVASLSSYTTAFEESIDDIGLIKEIQYMFNGLIPYVACLATDVAIIYVVVLLLILHMQHICIFWSRVKSRAKT